MILAGALWCAPALAQQTEAEAGFRNLLTAIQFGAVDQATALRTRLSDVGRLSDQEEKFIAGLLAARLGDFPKAELIFRDLLDADPHQRLVRFELIKVLVQRENYIAARFHLDLLDYSEQDPDLKGVYRHLRALIAKRQPFEGHLEFAIVPSSNANSGSSQETIYIDGLPFRINANSQAQADVGVKFNAGVTHRTDLSGGRAVFLRGFAHGIKYANIHNDQIGVGVGAFVRQTLDYGLYFDGGLDVSALTQGTELYSTSITPHFAFRSPLMDQLSMLIQGQISYIDYRDPGLRDGIGGRFKTSFSYAPTAGVNYGAFVAYDFDSSNVSAAQFDALKVGTNLYRELPHGLSVDLSLSGGVRRYRGIFPTQVFARQDAFINTSLALTKRDWAIAGFAPKATLFYEYQWSNVPLYTHDRYGVSLGVSRSF